MNERTKYIDTRFGGNAADSLLQNEIDALDVEVKAEEERAKKEEKRLDEKIDAETERAVSEEHRIEGRLDEEIERAESEEQRIETKLDDEIERSIAEDERLDQKIDDETARAQEAERALDGKIDAETERAEGAERVLDGKIDKEIEDRIADVDAEEAARIAADEALDQKIDQEIHDRIADVDAEEAARIAAVAAEAQAREEADAEEAQAREKADAEEAAARVLGDESLQDQIDTIEARSDVVDVVACYDKDDYEEPKPDTDLVHYDTSGLSDNDIVKVLIDETHDNSVSYYRWVITSASGEPTEGEWVFVGSVEAYYTKSETDAIVEELHEQIDKDIEVVPYQTTTPLTDEQIAKALDGKLAVYYQGALMFPYQFDTSKIEFIYYGKRTSSSSSSSGSFAVRGGLEYHYCLLNRTTKKLESINNSGTFYCLVDATGNVFENTDTPAASGEQAGKKVVRALNLRKTQDMIASVYDASSTYAVGDYAIYQNNLYRCISAIETAEDFTASHWEQVRASEVNNEDDIEIMNVSSGQILTQEQYNKVLRGKLLLKYGEVYGPIGSKNSTYYNLYPTKLILQARNPGGENVNYVTSLNDGSLDVGIEDRRVYTPSPLLNVIKDDIGNFKTATSTLTANGRELIRSLNLYKTQGMMAPVYSSSSTYNEGDYVIYQNDFYKCISAITVAESWTPARWTKSSLSEMLDDIHTATDLEILRLFREECTITSNITNGSASGDSTIWTEETASVTIAANSGYSLPETITVVGASYTYDSTTGVVALSDATGNVIITATCPIHIDMPAKGDIIKLDNGTARYRVLKTHGNVAEVMALDDANSKFNNSSITTTFSDGSTGQKYEGSTLDNYMNSTFYNSLSANVKNAIIQKAITQSLYQYSSSEISGYDFAMTLITSETRWYKRKGEVSVGNRYCYALDVDDVAEYFGASSGNTISSADLNDMFFEQTTAISKDVWLDSACSGSSRSVFYVYGNFGYVFDYNCRSSYVARPAFQVDLTNLAWAKEVNVPNKGDIITIDGGSARFRVLGVSGNEALLLAMDDYTESVYNGTITTKTFDGGKTGLKYEGSTLDTLLNETYYNSLSSNVKSAIVDQTIIQRMYEWYDPDDHPDDPSCDYHQQYNFSGMVMGLKIKDQTTVGSRHVFALDIKDIFDYLGKDTMTSAELNDMLFEQTTPIKKYVLLSSVDCYSSDITYGVLGRGGFVNSGLYNSSGVTRPAFKVDISKLTWAKEE